MNHIEVISIFHPFTNSIGEQTCTFPTSVSIDRIDMPLSPLTRCQHLLFSLLCLHPGIQLQLDTGLVRSPSQLAVPHTMS